MTAAWLLLAYLAGTIPTAWLVGRAFGVDLREHGSGNLGATNAYRVLGAKAGVPVVVVDVLKGWVPAAMFPAWDGTGAPGLAVACGLLAIAGHVWPVWLRFRGGKGVATGAGVLVALAPLTALVALLVWLGVVSLTRIVSAASLAAATTTPVVAWITDAPSSTVWFCGFVALFVWWTHRANLQRLRAGEELRFRRSQRTKTEGDGR
ncbi:MAG: glycerol-3-phosphate 1-O-acyltransferase PlsY [Gemmatimonadota bacterium]